MQMWDEVKQVAHADGAVLCHNIDVDPTELLQLSNADLLPDNLTQYGASIRAMLQYVSSAM